MAWERNGRHAKWKLIVDTFIYLLINPPCNIYAVPGNALITFLVAHFGLTQPPQIQLNMNLPLAGIYEQDDMIYFKKLSV